MELTSRRTWTEGKGGEEKKEEEGEEGKKEGSTPFVIYRKGTHKWYELEELK